MSKALPVINPDRLRDYLKDQARDWGGNVRRNRLARKWTLEQLAGFAHTTPQTIHKIERGEIVARDSVRFALAMALMVEVGDLFPHPTRQAIHAKAAA